MVELLSGILLPPASESYTVFPASLALVSCQGSAIQVNWLVIGAIWLSRTGTRHDDMQLYSPVRPGTTIDPGGTLKTVRGFFADGSLP